MQSAPCVPANNVVVKCRRKNFEDALQKINQHNQEEMDTGKHGYELGVNPYSDMVTSYHKNRICFMKRYHLHWHG